MFRIGEFSRIGCVTIDTLRHYDALDLLKPAKVDPLTGYRYYSAKQLQSLNRIIALKEVGFSLEENMPAHRYRMVCAPREFYYGSPEKGDLAAEIQFPVEKV